MEKTDLDKLSIYGTFIGNSNEESHFSFGVTTSVVKATGGEVSLDCGFIVGRYRDFWYLQHDFSIEAHLLHLREVTYHTEEDVAITIRRFRQLQICFGRYY